MNHSGNHHNRITCCLGIVVGTSLGAVLYLYYQNILLKRELSESVNKQPQEQEQQLETCNNNNNNNSNSNSNNSNNNNNNNNNNSQEETHEMYNDDDESRTFNATVNNDKEGFKYYTMREIGTIRSPYPHRAGTPRQGLLASHSRSHLELHSHVVPKECLDGLEEYSHVWIFFQFHLNPVGKQGKLAPKKKNKGNNNNNNNAWFKSTKVKPPRANGKKVGVLATRSPHRPNNIGLSLAKLESITSEQYHEYDSDHNSSNIQTRKKTRPKKRTIIKLLGLDLVDGTPIYDIKPYLPWDQVTPTCRQIISTSIQNNVHTEKQEYSSSPNESNVLKVPSWVSADDELASVTWTKDSYNFVLDSRNKGDLSPLYRPIHKNRKRVNNNNEVDDEVHKAIAEIIAQDPRAQHEGRGQIMTDNDLNSYDITFCTLRISFIIIPQQQQPQLTATNAYSSKNVAKIIKVVQDPGDPDARPGSYQHSLAMRRIVEREQSLCSGMKQIRWKYPIREGCTEGIYDVLQGGTCEPSKCHTNL